MKTITINANLDNISSVEDFIDECLEDNNIPLNIQTGISVAVDEIASNIARYAYPENSGNMTVEVDVRQQECRVCIKFIDNGIPYNPLTHDDPDVSLDIENRKIGGLGIYMVKKSMDEVKYEFIDNQNILTIVKKVNKDCFD